MILIFDCETNGKILDFAKPCEVVDNYPRLSQLSYQMFDESGKLVKKVDQFVFPDGWSFPENDFFKQHADINKNRELGKPVKEVLEAFIVDRQASHHIVAHNMAFDSKVIRAEMIRGGYNGIEFTAKKICTMQSSRKHCDLKDKNGRGSKNPKLEELHRHLFGCNFEHAHDSAGDVDATAKCFFELLRLGVVKLD